MNDKSWLNSEWISRIAHNLKIWSNIRFIRHHARFETWWFLLLLLWTVKARSVKPSPSEQALCPQQFNLDLIRRLEQHLEWSRSTVLCTNSYLVPPKDWQIHRALHNPNASFWLFHHTRCPQRTYSKSKQSLKVEPDKHYLNEKVFKETRLPPTHSPFGGPKFGWIKSIVTSYN